MFLMVKYKSTERVFNIDLSTIVLSLKIPDLLAIMKHCAYVIICGDEVTSYVE